MRYVLYILIQCTWGLLQTLIGLVLFLRYLSQPHFFWRGAIVTLWPPRSSISLGLFLFVASRPPEDHRRKHPIPAEELAIRLLVHEYGHSIQSLMMGPFYLPVIGLPSLIWSTCGRTRWVNRSYFRFWTERSANSLGEKATGQPSMGDAVI